MRKNWPRRVRSVRGSRVFTMEESYTRLLELQSRRGDSFMCAESNGSGRSSLARSEGAANAR